MTEMNVTEATITTESYDCLNTKKITSTEIVI